MNQCGAVLNVIGLSLDMIGVIGLFFTTTKGITKISKVRSFSSIEQLVNRTGGNSLNRTFDNLVDHINYTLSRNVEENRGIKRRANYWLIPIIVGFLLQLGASIWQFYLA